jgi:hypothetical protein
MKNVLPTWRFKTTSLECRKERFKFIRFKLSLIKAFFIAWGCTYHFILKVKGALFAIATCVSSSMQRYNNTSFLDTSAQIKSSQSIGNKKYSYYSIIHHFENSDLRAYQ